MQPMVLVLVLFLLSSMVAGCLGDGDGGDPAPSPTTGADGGGSGGVEPSASEASAGSAELTPSPRPDEPDEPSRPPEVLAPLVVPYDTQSADETFEVPVDAKRLAFGLSLNVSDDGPFVVADGVNGEVGLWVQAPSDEVGEGSAVSWALAYGVGAAGEDVEAADGFEIGDPEAGAWTLTNYGTAYNVENIVIVTIHFA